MQRKQFKIENRSVDLSLFDSPAEFAGECERVIGEQLRATRKNKGSGWLGGETLASAAEKCRTGDDRLVTDAEKVLGQINHAGIDLPRTEYAASVAGQFPVVGDYLAGRPDCMRRKISASSDRAPVRIYVDGTNSGGIDAGTLHRRGTALLAFVMVLSGERPVELYTVTALDSGGSKNYSAVVCRIQSAPLELSTACFALTNQGYVRGLGYQYLRKQADAAGGWGWGIYPDGKNPNCEYRRLSRLAFGLAPDDVFISAVCVYDDLLKSPAQWVNRMLDHYRQRDDEQQAA